MKPKNNFAEMLNMSNESPFLYNYKKCQFMTETKLGGTRREW